MCVREDAKARGVGECVCVDEGVGLHTQARKPRENLHTAQGVCDKERDWRPTPW